MLNNCETRNWVEKYPEIFKNIKGKGICYYAGRIPLINRMLNKWFTAKNTERLNEWQVRRWLIYLIVAERYEDGVRFLRKNEIYFSKYDSCSMLYNDLEDEGKRLVLSQSRNIDNVRSRLNICKILGEDYKARYKVRIVHSFPHFWNTIQTVAENLVQHNELEVEIVLCSPDKTDLETMTRQMEEEGYDYICSNEYNVEIDKPDIVIFYVAHTDVYFKLLGGGKIDKIRQSARYIAVVPFDNAVMFSSDIRMEMYYDLVEELRADIFIVSKPIYNSIKDKYMNTVQMDSPKFDAIYRKLVSRHNACLPQSWTKLSGRKIVLWTTVHGHDERDSSKFFETITFDLYIKEILDYFKMHPEMGLIFRPHPKYIRELVDQHGIWTKEDLQYIKGYFEQSDNMVWDDSLDYSGAFAASDALFTDDGTGITLSYLPTRKPICILRRNKVEIFTGTQNVTRNYYKAHDFSELKAFFEMVSEGKDPLYEKRIETVEEYIPVFDGKNGARIADKIITDFRSKSVCDRD